MKHFMFLFGFGLWDDANRLNKYIWSYEKGQPHWIACPSASTIFPIIGYVREMKYSG